MSEIIFLSDVRLSFPHIVEPQVSKNEKTGVTRTAYNADFIMPKDHPGLAQFMQRYAAIAQERWKENANTVMQMIHNDRKSRCYGAGEEKINSKTFQVYSGYAGMMYISASSERRPQIIDADGKPVDPNNTMAYRELTSKMYAGCRVNAAVKPWPQMANREKNYGNGVRSDFVAIQFLRDDEPFGEGAPDVAPLFGAVGSTSGNAAAPVPPMGLPPFMMGGQ